MPSLPELQRCMLDALLGDDARDAATALIAGSLIAGSPVSAATQLDVYRNNVRTNFIDALASTFPVLLRLVGYDYFRQTAREFHRRHPSLSGDLQHAGQAFPDFIGASHASGEFAYLADIARLEWQVQETLLAGSHPAFDLGKLAGVEPTAYDGLKFLLHPSVRLFESIFPAQRIWRQNLGDGEPDAIDLRAGGERVLLQRRKLELHCRPLDRSEFAFLQALRDQREFAAAVAIAVATAEAAAFDAAAALRRLVADEVIVDFR